MSEETLQLGPLKAFTGKQEQWARDVRLRIYTGLLLHFGVEHRALIIRECNRFTNWFDWTLYQSGTRDLVKERVEGALKKAEVN